ncbi:MAG: protease modulator HflC [Verrucomicrobia bacterium]|nr:protease modulator HflC [Verrucomicrobiota bacterium]
MKTAVALIATLVGLALLLIGFLGSTYVVNETDQVILTQFGDPVGGPVTNAGLHFKTPFIQDVNRIEKRALEWDGRPTEMPTKDKTYIITDMVGRWRIKDPKQFFLRLRDERSAHSRLDDILGSETRSSVAKHELIEIVRTAKDRKPAADEALEAAGGRVGQLYPIHIGRTKVEEEIFTNSAPKLVDFGIELLDVRFMRINYNPSVQQRIHERMISERQQIAERFRSEGAGEAAKILGKKQKDLQEIESESYRKVQEIRGAADAKAAEIFTRAYNQSPEAADFYGFVKTLETYQKMLGKDTTLILTTDSDLFRHLKQITPKAK